MKQTIFDYKKLSIILGLLAFCTPAQSFASSYGGYGRGTGGAKNGVYFEETFFPVYVNKNDSDIPYGDPPVGGSPVSNGSIDTESGLGVDSRTTLGYVWQNILIGITYNYYNLSSSLPAASAANLGHTTTTKRYELGPTLGYFLGNWRFAFTYFMDATKTVEYKAFDPTGVDSTDNIYQNTGASGYQLAVGYDFNIGAGFGISPTLVFQQLSYSKQSMTDNIAGSSDSYTSQTLQTKALDNELLPMITVNVMF